MRGWRGCGVISGRHVDVEALHADALLLLGRLLFACRIHGGILPDLGCWDQEEMRCHVLVSRWVGLYCQNPAEWRVARWGVEWRSPDQEMARTLPFVSHGSRQGDKTHCEQGVIIAGLKNLCAMHGTRPLGSSTMSELERIWLRGLVRSVYSSDERKRQGRCHS